MTTLNEVENVEAEVKALCQELNIPAPIEIPVTLKQDYHARLEHLIQTGIPVTEATFHAAVNNAEHVPETKWSLLSDKASRRVEMWVTSADLLVFKHKGKKGFTPMANVIFGFFKE